MVNWCWRLPAVAGYSGRKGSRVVEEMTVYAEDGTMLGTMTCSRAVVASVRGTPRWLTPVYVRTDMTREDLVRRYGRADS